MSPPQPQKRSSLLPTFLRSYFWDYDFHYLDWEKDRNLIIKRLLSSGGMRAIHWLRSRLGDQELKEWILSRRGARLSPRRLRFWEIMLDLPHHEVDTLVKTAREKIWGKKSQLLKFHPEVLTPSQKKIFGQFGFFFQKREFYLGGGTKLAIHLGHRHSLDLDWFTQKKIYDPMALANSLQDCGIPFITEKTAEGTLYGTIYRVRVSLLEYKYPLVKPPVLWPEMNCQLASRVQALKKKNVRQ